jgi:hypothetical protein
VLKPYAAFGWHAFPVGHVGEASVASQMMSPAHELRQDTGSPSLTWQHRAGKPRDAVHCDESLHDEKTLGVWHVALAV